MWVVDIAKAVFGVGLLLLSVGVLAHSEELLAVGCMAVAWGYAARDYFSPRPDSITVMTVYALAAGLWYGLGNLVGYLVGSGPYRDMFYKYDAPAFIFEAQLLGTMAVA